MLTAVTAVNYNKTNAGFFQNLPRWHQTNICIMLTAANPPPSYQTLAPPSNSLLQTLVHKSIVLYPLYVKVMIKFRRRRLDIFQGRLPVHRYSWRRIRNKQTTLYPRMLLVEAAVDEAAVERNLKRMSQVKRLAGTFGMNASRAM